MTQPAWEVITQGNGTLGDASSAGATPLVGNGRERRPEMM